MDIVTLALAKKYVADSLVGVGALKGSPCTIKSITAITGGSRITFSWTDTDDVEHTNTLDVMNGANGDKGDDGETPDMTNYYTKTEVDNAIENAMDDIPEGGNGTTVIANPILSGNEELATSIQIGDEKYVFPQTNTNGLTSAQITMLESVLYSVAFTDASGKAKVDALITSLRSGATPSEPTGPDDDNPDTPSPEEPENPDDGGDTPTPEEPTSEKILTFEYTSGKNINPSTGLTDATDYWATLNGVDISGYDYLICQYKDGQSGYSLPNVIFSNRPIAESDVSGFGTKVSSANAQSGEIFRCAIGARKYAYLATSKVGATYLDRVIWKAIKES